MRELPSLALKSHDLQVLRPLQRQAPLAREHLQALLKHVCLRRSKTMTVRRGGVEQPLVALPPKTVEVRRGAFGSSRSLAGRRRKRKGSC